MERSKIALDKATNKFQELHLKINDIVSKLNVFGVKLDHLKIELEAKKRYAKEAATPGFWGTIFFLDYSEEERVVHNYENAIGSTSAAMNNKGNFLIYFF